MKKIAMFSMLLISTLCFGGNPHGPAEQVQKGHAMIMLPTLQCDTCVETVRKAVEKVEGVKSISIDLEKKMAHVRFDPAKTSQEKIEQAIAAAGYDANQTKRDEIAYAKLPQCCQSLRK